MPFTHTSHKVAIRAARKHVFTRARQSEYTSRRENVCRPARAPRFRTPPMPARSAPARTKRCEFSNRHDPRAPRCYHIHNASRFLRHSLAAAPMPRPPLRTSTTIYYLSVLYHCMPWISTSNSLRISPSSCHPLAFWLLSHSFTFATSPAPSLSPLQENRRWPKLVVDICINIC